MHSPVHSLFSLTKGGESTHSSSTFGHSTLLFLMTHHDIALTHRHSPLGVILNAQISEHLMNFSQLQTSLMCLEDMV